MATMSDPSNTNFTVFVRLPFPRGDFVDPPLVSLSTVQRSDRASTNLTRWNGMDPKTRSYGIFFRDHRKMIWTVCVSLFALTSCLCAGCSRSPRETFVIAPPYSREMLSILMSF